MFPLECNNTIYNDKIQQQTTHSRQKRATTKLPPRRIYRFNTTIRRSLWRRHHTTPTALPTKSNVRLFISFPFLYFFSYVSFIFQDIRREVLLQIKGIIRYNSGLKRIRNVMWHYMMYSDIEINRTDRILHSHKLIWLWIRWASSIDSLDSKFERFLIACRSIVIAIISKAEFWIAIIRFF